MAISLFFANKRTRADPAEHRAHAALGPSQTPARAGVGAYIIRPDENKLLPLGRAAALMNSGVLLSGTKSAIES